MPSSADPLPGLLRAALFIAEPTQSLRVWFHAPPHGASGTGPRRKLIDLAKMRSFWPFADSVTSACAGLTTQPVYGWHNLPVACQWQKENYI